MPRRATAKVRRSRKRHTSRVGLRADEQEIVVHDRPPKRPVAFGHELRFSGRIMDQEHIGIATTAQFEGLAGPHRGSLDLAGYWSWWPESASQRAATNRPPQARAGPRAGI